MLLVRMDSKRLMLRKRIGQINLMVGMMTVTPSMSIDGNISPYIIDHLGQ
jgi:hypothetical protein